MCVKHCSSRVLNKKDDRNVNNKKVLSEQDRQRGKEKETPCIISSLFTNSKYIDCIAHLKKQRGMGAC